MAQFDAVNSAVRPEYRKVVVGSFLNPGEHSVTIKGEHYWNPYFVERANDYQGYFEILLIDDLVNQVGEYGWAVRFIQVSQETVSWFADVYVDDDALYAPICEVVRQRTPLDFKLTFFKKGRISDYLIS